MVSLLSQVLADVVASVAIALVALVLLVDLRAAFGSHSRSGRY